MVQTPPFNISETTPGDTSAASGFPANERLSRDVIESYLNTDHDSATGHHTKTLLVQQSTDPTVPGGVTGGIIFSKDVSGVPELFYTDGTNTLQLTSGGQLNGAVGSSFNAAGLTGTAPVSVVPDLPASKVTSEEFEVARIPNLPFSKITGLVTVPPGTVSDFAGANAPAGWLLCYGQAVSRSTYAALFLAIGTTYGAGNGSSTFNLPDLRGRVSAGQDDMGGTSANRLTSPINGDNLGASGGSQSTTDVPAHTHGAGTLAADSAGAHRHSANGVRIGTTPGGTATRFGLGVNVGTNATASVNEEGEHAHSISGSTASEGQAAVSNVQPTLVLNKIIKT